MIYLLEDDENIRSFVTYALRNTGLNATGFAHPKELRAALSEKLPDLILLDIMLPDEDGLSILSSLKANPTTADIPVVMLTAKGSEFDKVVGLDNGADDYIVKPFGAMELISRIKAVLRRYKKPSDKDDLTIDGLCVSPSRHTVHVNGEPVTLTLKEFELLCLLLNNKGTVQTRDVILNKVWGYGFDGESRTVDVHIRSLRSKLGECGNLIETVRGVGYKIAEL